MTLEATAPARAARRIPWTLFLAVILADMLVIGGSLAFWPSDAGLLHAARYTARLSFLIFLAPFLAASLAWWLPSPLTRTMRAKRRYLGLSFALAHFIHLAALASFFIVSGQTPNIVTLLGGGAAYVFIALMALTSNDWSVRALGPKSWGWLHRIGLYDIWFIFAFSYFGRLTKAAPQEPRWIYATLFSISVAALLLRLATARARERQRDAT